MNNQKQSFAFRLAEKASKASDKKWFARDGVAVAGCTSSFGGLLRASTRVSRDGGLAC